jgi:hypothetical protein
MENSRFPNKITPASSYTLTMKIFALLAAAAFALPSAALAGKGHGGHGGHHGGGHHGGHWGGHHHSGHGHWGGSFGYRPYYGYSGYGYGYGYPYYYSGWPSLSFSYSSGPRYYSSYPAYRSYSSYRNVSSLEAVVQQELRQQGYYRGAIDGDIGPASRAAIRSYQADNGLSVTGRIDSQLLRALGVRS